jgi:hypothetical protein
MVEQTANVVKVQQPVVSDTPDAPRSRSVRLIGFNRLARLVGGQETCAADAA